MNHKEKNVLINKNACIYCLEENSAVYSREYSRGSRSRYRETVCYQCKQNILEDFIFDFHDIGIKSEDFSVFSIYKIKKMSEELNNLLENKIK